MSLAKLQKPIESLSIGELRLGPEGRRQLEALRIATVGDMLWRWPILEADRERGDESREPDALDHLFVAATLYCVPRMQADVALGLAVSGIRSVEALADIDPRKLEKLVAKLPLERPPSIYSLAQLQVGAARRAGTGAVFGTLAAAEGAPALRSLAAWVDGVPADVDNKKGAFAVFGLAPGRRRLLVRSPEHLELRLPVDVAADVLQPPLTLVLPAAPVPVPAPAPEPGSQPAPERETVGQPFFEYALGGEVEADLSALPDGTYLLLTDEGSLVHLLRARRDGRVVTEVVASPDPAAPEDAQPGSILRWEQGALTLTDLDLEAFALLKAGVPDPDAEEPA